MALASCRVYIVGPNGLVDTLKYMVREMGGTVLWPWQESSATHVVATQSRPVVGEATYVHPLWVARCYNTKARVDEQRYKLTYLSLVSRCGTEPQLGSVDVFDRELPMFHAVEVMLYLHEIDATLGDALRAEGAFDLRASEAWLYACHMLGSTVFWGYRLREMNWRARRAVVMCLQCMYAKGMGPMDVQPGAAALMLSIGPDLCRAVIMFL